jgi:hypothetical protein
MNQPAKKNPLTTKRIGETKDETDSSSLTTRKPKQKVSKKVLYLEIDDEITAIYDKLKNLKMKNVYIVAPKRAVLFQSIVNLKILKRKAEDLDKNIYIITNDQNGIHLAKKIGLAVYDKLEGHEHPSLVSGKFMEDQQDITPLKASINTLEDDTPMRRTEKKFSISELIKRGGGKLGFFPKNQQARVKIGSQQEKKKEQKGRLVLVAPNRQALISLVIVSLIILLTITYIALPGATIALTPKSNILKTSVNITLADIEANRAELDTNPFHEIPSYTIQKKIQRVLTYTASGKEFKGENAGGIITVVNTSGNDWPLVAKTRFQTGNGLVFRSQNATKVPAARDNQPGTVDIAVTADEKDAYDQIMGEKGNIGPTKFFLPGLSAENQKKLYAESKIAFTGGKTAVINTITKQDLEQARTKMIGDLKASAQAELQANVKERNDTQKTNLSLLTGTNAIVTSDPKVTIADNLEGQKLQTFDVQGEIVAVGTAYSADDLLSILKTELKLKKNPEKRLVYIQEDSLTQRIIDNDKNGKKIKITATIQGIEEFEISPDKENGDRLIKKIKEHVVNKDVKEAEQYIQNLPEIDKVTISSWPAWAPTLPGIPDNIKIEIRRPDITANIAPENPAP